MAVEDRVLLAHRLIFNEYWSACVGPVHVVSHSVSAMMKLPQ